jgi:D-alanyl-lipoteichoic acid acyltransferase DltB (MBOAT superfamily)
VGLFAQNRWTEAMRPRYAALESRPRLRQAATLLSTALTFVYVTLGWVFFALPDPGLSLRVLGKMFGVG